MLTSPAAAVAQCSLSTVLFRSRLALGALGERVHAEVRKTLRGRAAAAHAPPLTTQRLVIEAHPPLGMTALKIA